MRHDIDSLTRRHSTGRASNDGGLISYGPDFLDQYRRAV
jgi:hypothetical protein